MSPSSQLDIGAIAESAKKAARWSDKHLRDAARWVAHRGSKGSEDDTPVLESAPSDAVLDQWRGLANAVQTLAMSRVPLGHEITNFLAAVSGSEDAQTALLKNIDAKVDALVKGPYNTGRTYMREAQRLGPDDSEVGRCLEAARDEFYAAHGQAASVQGRSLVEYHLGISLLLMGRREDAIHWLAECHASVMAVVDELARLATNAKVGDADATSSWKYAADVLILGTKFRKLVTAERARGSLIEMLPFLDCVARSHNSLVDPPNHLPTLSLVTLGEEQFELVQVPV